MLFSNIIPGPACTPNHNVKFRTLLTGAVPYHTSIGVPVVLHCTNLFVYPWVAFSPLLV